MQVSPKKRQKLAVSWFLAWSTLSYMACEPLRGHKHGAPPRAFEIRLLGAESCPLPAHLNPKSVALLSYRVRLSSHHPSGVAANYFYATLLTTDGERYLSDFYGCAPLLAADPLQAGEQAEGFLNFSIPLSKIPEKLVYSPVLMHLPDGQAVEEIALEHTDTAQLDDGLPSLGQQPTEGEL